MTSCNTCVNNEVSRQRQPEQISYTKDNSFLKGKKKAALCIGGILTNETLHYTKQAEPPQGNTTGRGSNIPTQSNTQ